MASVRGHSVSAASLSRLQILKVEGTPALYAGLGPSIAAIIPEAAITYGMFDVLKKSYSQMRGVAEPPVVVSLAFGVSSAFMGQLVAYPLETVSRRMQVTRPSLPPCNRFLSASANFDSLAFSSFSLVVPAFSGFLPSTTFVSMS